MAAMAAIHPMSANHRIHAPWRAQNGNHLKLGLFIILLIKSRKVDVP